MNTELLHRLWCEVCTLLDFDIFISNEVEAILHIYGLVDSTLDAYVGFAKLVDIQIFREIINTPRVELQPNAYATLCDKYGPARGAAKMVHRLK